MHEGFQSHIKKILNDKSHDLTNRASRKAEQNKKILTEYEVLYSINEIFPENLKQHIIEKIKTNSQNNHLIQLLDDFIANEPFQLTSTSINILEEDN